MLPVPSYLTWLFIGTTLLGFLLLVLSMAGSKIPGIRSKSNIVALPLLLWLIFQSALALNGWYMDRKAMPPHAAFPVVVGILVLLFLFTVPRAKKFVDGLSLQMLIWLHVIRIPVEICLYGLAKSKQVPFSMTFAGYNYDIIFGITAPVIAILYSKKIIRPAVFKIWNVLGLISVISVVVQGIGSVPGSMQWLNFSQPNYAVMHFPFIWLPSFVVPLVVLSHIAAMRRAGSLAE